MMTTDSERREVAARLRSLRMTAPGVTSVGHGHLWSLLWAVSGEELGESNRCDWFERMCSRLADLIEPTDGFDLDTVQRVCFECMEGCDEPEWTLYTTIYDAIARYKRGESGPTYERGALLALAEGFYSRADDIMRAAQHARFSELGPTMDEAKHEASMWRGIARRIREALEVSDGE